MHRIALQKENYEINVKFVKNGFGLFLPLFQIQNVKVSWFFLNYGIKRVIVFNNLNYIKSKLIGQNLNMQSIALFKSNLKILKDKDQLFPFKKIFQNERLISRRV